MKGVQTWRRGLASVVRVGQHTWQTLCPRCSIRSFNCHSPYLFGGMEAIGQRQATHYVFTKRCRVNEYKAVRAPGLSRRALASSSESDAAESMDDENFMKIALDEAKRAGAKGEVSSTLYSTHLCRFNSNWRPLPYELGSSGCCAGQWRRRHHCKGS